MKTLIILLVLASAVLAQVSLTNPASLKEQAPATFNAKFSTTAGDFTIQVTRAWSPNGADRFYNLVKNGFFTDASFFRVLRGFIAQFGMPADPKLNTIWQNATIKDDPKNQSNTQGTIVFATAGPNTRSCQFFINLGNNAAGLDPGIHRGTRVSRHSARWFRASTWCRNYTAVMGVPRPRVKVGTARSKMPSRVAARPISIRTSPSWTALNPRR